MAKNQAQDRSQISQAICRFLTEHILAEHIKIDERVSLSEAGVDSMAWMKIILFVEREYGMQFPLEHLTPRNTENVETFAALLESLLEPSGAGRRT